MELREKEVQEILVKSEVQELNDMQLALIGGGIGETVL
jgi:hypothetical protein